VGSPRSRHGEDTDGVPADIRAEDTDSLK